VLTSEHQEHMATQQTTTQSRYKFPPLGTAISGNFLSISIVRAS